MWIYLQGAGIGAGLIIAIGAQNSFVLAQGIKRQNPFKIAAICSLCDMFLILIGTTSVGTLLASSPRLIELATWGGALFLAYYGFRAGRSALRGGKDLEQQNRQPSGQKVLLTALALSLLNPHVYLDTCVLLGTIGSRFPVAERYHFAAGAMSASILWFFSLSFGASLLAPLFRKASAWRILDGGIALVMWSIAVSLIQGA